MQIIPTKILARPSLIHFCWNFHCSNRFYWQYLEFSIKSFLIKRTVHFYTRVLQQNTGFVKNSFYIDHNMKTCFCAYCTHIQLKSFQVNFDMPFLTAKENGCIKENHTSRLHQWLSVQSILCGNNCKKLTTLRQ